MIKHIQREDFLSLQRKLGYGRLLHPLCIFSTIYYPSQQKNRQKRTKKSDSLHFLCKKILTKYHENYKPKKIYNHIENLFKSSHKIIKKLKLKLKTTTKITD